MNKKNVIKEIMKLATTMARKKKGSFYIITKESLSKHYETLYPELFSGKNVRIDNEPARTLLLYLSEMDGAIVINENGIIETYGAKIKKTKILPGHGTRHSAALGISRVQGTLVIISSEEDGLIRTFDNGKLVAEINPETGKNTKFIDRFAELFTKTDIQVATSSGIASLLIGLNPLVAGAVFTGSWIITKYGLASMKDFIKTGRIVVDKEIKEPITRHIAKNIKKNK